MSSLASAELPVLATVTFVHTVPLSIVGRFGLAEPDQLVGVPQFPTILSDHELSVPTSMLARSWTSSFHVPAATWPLNAAIAWFEITMLSAEPPVRFQTTNCAPPGEISVTLRSP